MKREWEPFFVLCPRRIEGRWVWLSKAERAMACGGSGLGGDFWWIYRSADASSRVAQQKEMDE